MLLLCIVKLDKWFLSYQLCLMKGNDKSIYVWNIGGGVRTMSEHVLRMWWERTVKWYTHDSDTDYDSDS